MTPAPAELAGFLHRFEPAAGSSRATLLLLHGTGGDENDLIPLARTLAPGVALLSPRGQVIEQGMPRFFRRIELGVFDLPDLIARTHALADFVTEASRRYGFDITRLYALGYSNGANIAASLLLSRPAVLRGGVLLRAMLPFEPAATLDLEGHSVLLAGGRRDPLIPPAGTERLATLLRSAGADVTVHWVDAGHPLTASDVDAAREWLSPLVGPASENRPAAAGGDAAAPEL